MGKKTRRTAFPANSQRHAAAATETHDGHHEAHAHESTHRDTHAGDPAPAAATHHGDHHQGEDKAQS